MGDSDVTVADTRPRDGAAGSREPWWRRIWPVHPLLFAAYPILFLFAENIAEQLSVEPMLLPLGLALAGALALLVILRLVFRDWLRAAVATSVAVALFFSYGHVRNALDVAIEGGVRQRYLLPAWALLLIIGFVVAWRLRPGALRTTTTVLNVASAFLVVINAMPIVGFQLSGAAPVAAQNEPIPSAAVSVDERPDIYYIVLDRYPSAGTLRDVYGFDNTAFLAELERRGFYVASESNANYLKTILSLTSSLNMDFHDLATLRAEADSREDLKPLYRRLGGGQAVQNFLKSLGYTYVHLGSRYQLSATNSAADLNIRYSEDSEFVNVLAETTLLSAASALFPEEEADPYYVAWKYSLYQFDQVERLASRAGPKFVLAHLGVPHPPFVFDRDGNFVPHAEQRARGWNRGFVEMVEYANKRTLELLDVLQAGPEESDPVIIIQSDEGPYPVRRAYPDQNRWDQATPEELREKFGILNAYYLPRADDPTLYPSISPVNSFRVLFNAYFGTDLELLPDRSYVPIDVRFPYEQIDITDKLDGSVALYP